MAEYDTGPTAGIQKLEMELKKYFKEFERLGFYWDLLHPIERHMENAERKMKK
jgi:hypothetical protein